MPKDGFTMITMIHGRSIINLGRKLSAEHGSPANVGLNKKRKA